MRKKEELIFILENNWSWDVDRLWQDCIYCPTLGILREFWNCREITAWKEAIWPIISLWALFDSNSAGSTPLISPHSSGPHWTLWLNLFTLLPLAVNSICCLNAFPPAISVFSCQLSKLIIFVLDQFTIGISFSLFTLCGWFIKLNGSVRFTCSHFYSQKNIWLSTNLWRHTVNLSHASALHGFPKVQCPEFAVKLLIEAHCDFHVIFSFSV